MKMSIGSKEINSEGSFKDKDRYKIRIAKHRQKQGYDVYDPKTKHWSSVDPKTNKFLKSSKHSTLYKELDWYNSDDGKKFKEDYKLVTKNILGRERNYYKYKKRKK